MITSSAMRYTAHLPVQKFRGIFVFQFQSDGATNILDPATFEGLDLWKIMTLSIKETSL